MRANEYGPPEVLRCRVDFGQKKVRSNASGAAQEVIATGTVFFSAGVDIRPEDEIVFDGRRYTVLSSRPCYDLFGSENHVEVVLQ